jgi:preprotein translocase subunit SecG
MGIYFPLIILIVIAAILMVGIVLIQESKGGGLASNFASYNQIGGVRKTTDFIEKATWTLAAFMVVVSVACAYVAPKAAGETNLIEQVETNPITSSSNANGIEATAAQQDAPVAAPEEAEAPAENE